MNPFLTIITASFNSEKTIADTIKSILSQNFTNYEYLVIDGGSSDNTLQIIKSFETQFTEKGINYQWISEQDSGIYDAWNKAVKLAQGQWITFIGSDDIFLPQSLSKMAQHAVSSQQYHFISAKARIMKGSAVDREFGEPWRWNVFKREMKILHAGGWHNALYFKKYGLFDTSYRIVGDYELLLRASKNLKVHFVDEFIIEMGGEGVSSTLIQKSLQEARIARIKNRARTPFMAWIDFYWVLLKIKLKTYV
jgi:glycosyltransferase involved in cell wall biosynthesis